MNNNKVKSSLNNEDKAKDFFGSLKKLLIYCKPYLPLIIITIICAILESICSIIGPNKLKDITNDIAKGIMVGIDLNKIKSIAIILFIIYGFALAFGYLQGFIMAKVTNKFSKKIRKEISKKINNLPLKYFDNTSFGDVLSIVTNDVDTLGMTLYNCVGSLFSSISLFLGVIAMIFITNWVMAITSIVSSLIGFIFMMFILSKSQKYFIRQQKELGNLNGHIEEIYSGHDVVKVYNGIENSNKEFDKINDRLYEASQKGHFLSGTMQPIMSFIGNFGYVCVCVVGAALVLKNSISIGTIVAFMIYVRLFTSPLITIAQSVSQLQSAAAASERIFAFLNQEEMKNEKNVAKNLDKTAVKGNIAFDHVKFGYSPEKVIINDFNAKVKAGQKIAIVGPTGAGKTTLVNLLMKFYEINSGDITIDGVSIKDLTRENIHDLFIMVLQDTWLFNGTVKDNIIFNTKDVSINDVIKICKIVGIDHFVKTLPDGYDSILSDVDNISVGQKQLLTIARGMIKNSPFLILDEATSSVDTRTEELVQKAMDKLMENRTSFIIAHRLSTIKNADLILVVKDGNIIEQGNHEELLSKKGFYAELYNSQFDKIN